MNIIRTIKLKHINGDLDSISEHAKVLFAILNNTKQISYPCSRYEQTTEIEFKTDDGGCVFSCNIERGRFWMGLDIFYEFQHKFGCNRNDAKISVQRIFEKYLNVELTNYNIFTK